MYIRIFRKARITTLKKIIDSFSLYDFFKCSIKESSHVVIVNARSNKCSSQKVISAKDRSP